MFKRLLGLMLLLGSFSSAADTYVWHTSKIKQVYPSGSGKVILTFHTPSSSCQHASKYHYIAVGEASVTEDGSDKLYSAALAAAMAGKAVTVNFNKDSEACFISRLYISF